MYLAFEEKVGEEAAATLMTILPPAGADLATTRDLDLLRAELHTDMAELRTELKGEISELKLEMSGLRADMANEFRKQTYTTVYAMIGLVATTAGTVFGALQLTGGG